MAHIKYIADAKVFGISASPDEGIDSRPEHETLSIELTTADDRTTS